MKLDRHHDPVGELEEKLIHELQMISRDLGGTMEKIITSNSTGRTSKKIVIEYDVNS